MAENQQADPPVPEQRGTELRVGENWKLQAMWHLTDTKLTDPVKITFPPMNAIPIIFVPGIMGSNLCNMKNEPVWLLNSIKDTPVQLAWSWSRKGVGARQTILHPDRTKVYALGAVPKDRASTRLSSQDYLKRGWGEVSEASYHKFLLWLDNKMNGDRNPANWDDFGYSVLDDPSAPTAKDKNLPPGLVMEMRGLPHIAESGYGVEPIKSDELLKRAKSIYPIYAFGYNWLASNSKAAVSLKRRIDKIIAENNGGAITCKQVILLTHSMGGLVARACSQLPGMTSKIVGIVHGVMPATGAAVAYRRCKVGMKDEDFGAGLVIGSDGKEVTAVFAQSPGPLQLLPSEDYGPKWLDVKDPLGRALDSLPAADPYQEIYLRKDRWWGLIREEWLNPKDGVAISWGTYEANIKQARDFHRSLGKNYHPRTYVFFGGGEEIGSYSNVSWKLRQGSYPERSGVAPSAIDVVGLGHNDVRTDGSNNLYVGGKTILTTTSRGDSPMAYANETSFWEIRCARQDSAGDGTVPVRSGRAPRHSGGQAIIQQFELDQIQHEPAYRDYPLAQQVAYYSITKLAALADLS